MEPNEKFGLLGYNGSGKTTTFRAITNEILYDSGKISLFGFDTKNQFNKIRRSIGYCPQENPLFDYMKVREIIQFYLKLKKCNDNVESVSQKFDLENYLDTFCVNLSEGNKRKLTVSIALMNYPKLLLLDEPTTGVDPNSRRIIWKNINNLSNNGNTYNMILSTHSIEEAEILCDRICWLKSGNFVCIGNPEKLKLQFSKGYKLHIKFDESHFNFNKNTISSSSDSAQELFNDIKELIEFHDFPDYVINYPNIHLYLKTLIEIIKKLKLKTERIILDKVGKDLSFEFMLVLIKDKKKDIFCDIMTLKNSYKMVSEIVISLESLENILISFK